MNLTTFTFKIPVWTFVCENLGLQEPWRLFSVHNFATYISIGLSMHRPPFLPILAYSLHLCTCQLDHEVVAALLLPAAEALDEELRKHSNTSSSGCGNAKPPSLWVLGDSYTDTRLLEPG